MDFTCKIALDRCLRVKIGVSKVGNTNISMPAVHDPNRYTKRFQIKGHVKKKSINVNNCEYFFCAEEVSPIVGGREHGSDGFEMDYNIIYIYMYISPQ